MVALGIPRPDLRRLVPGRREWKRALAAGLAFSMLLTAGLTAMAAWQCGAICPAEIADNAMLSFAAGFLGLGPIAAYGRRTRRTPRLRRSDIAQPAACDRPT